MKQFLIAAIAASSFSAINTHAQTSKLLLDNDKLRITEFISQPGEDVCGKGKHTHGDHATVLITDAQVKTVEADGTAVMETYLANKHLFAIIKNGATEKMNTDGTFWAKGTTHSVTNVGSKPIKFYIVETK